MIPDPTDRLPKPSIRIVLVEDHTLLRESMRRILNHERGLQVVGTAANRGEGLALIKTIQPDVLIQDVCLGEEDGLEMLREVKLLAPKTRCLVLTGFTDDGLLLQAIRQAADGFLLKSCSMPSLFKAIRLVADGHRAWDNDSLARLARLDSTPKKESQDTGMQSLAPLEFRIAKLIAEGLTNREIGQQLHLAEKTIRNRVSVIMDKLQVKRRAKIAALFIQHLEWPDKRKCLSLKGRSPSMKA
jgi:two-component system response regulator DevR